MLNIILSSTGLAVVITMTAKNHENNNKQHDHIISTCWIATTFTWSIFLLSSLIIYSTTP